MVLVIILQHHLRKVILVEVALRLEVLVVVEEQVPQVQILQVTLLLVLVVLVLYSHKFHHHMEHQVRHLVDGLLVVEEEDQLEHPQVLGDLVVEEQEQLILTDPTQQQTLAVEVVDLLNLDLTEVI